MPPRDLFGVIVRTVGLLSLLYSFQIMSIWFAYAAGARSSLESGIRGQALLLLVIGLVALRGADLIVRFAYPGSIAAAAD